MSDPKPFEVVLFPAPVLRLETEDVGTFDDELKDVVARMFETMFESHGVGLAAPQVGLSKRLFVLNDEGSRDQPERNMVLVNPVIKSLGGRKTRHEEGCLSLPGVHADITRPERCVVSYQDVDGNALEQEFEGFVSRIIQHEYDHLQGVLLVDRMTPADKQRNRAAVEELKDAYRRAVSL